MGRAWTRDPESTQSKVLAGLTEIYATNNARANQLLIDAFPATAVELLPEWEFTLGLPNPAAGPTPSLAARKLLVFARLVGPGGVSVSNYRGFAALLGFDALLTPNAPFRCGQSRCGQALGVQENLYGLTIMVKNSAANNSVFGEFGRAVLQSELQRVAPAHAVLNFIFI
jgi:uncharacterized protein YmfQ (DUF2313 family)